MVFDEMSTNGTGPDRTALVAYGTETGTAQDIAEEVARILERLHFITDVTGLDSVSAVCLNHQSVAFLADHRPD
jgi:menaquinone-dependent protoporphyrinogen IX oxidase